MHLSSVNFLSFGTENVIEKNQELKKTGKRHLGLTHNFSPGLHGQSCSRAAGGGRAG